jgi:hypothetical protein
LFSEKTVEERVAGNAMFVSLVPQQIRGFHHKGTHLHVFFSEGYPSQKQMGLYRTSEAKCTDTDHAKTLLSLGIGSFVQLFNVMVSPTGDVFVTEKSGIRDTDKSEIREVDKSMFQRWIREALVPQNGNWDNSKESDNNHFNHNTKSGKVNTAVMEEPANTERQRKATTNQSQMDVLGLQLSQLFFHKCLLVLQNDSQTRARGPVEFLQTLE